MPGGGKKGGGTATGADAVAERVRIMSAYPVTVLVRFDAGEIDVKDSRTSTENAAQILNGYEPGSWQRYEIGSAVILPDSQVTFP